MSLGGTKPGEADQRARGLLNDDRLRFALARVALSPEDSELVGLVSVAAVLSPGLERLALFRILGEALRPILAAPAREETERPWRELWNAIVSLVANGHEQSDPMFERLAFWAPPGTDAATYFDFGISSVGRADGFGAKAARLGLITKAAEARWPQSQIRRYHPWTVARDALLAPTGLSREELSLRLPHVQQLMPAGDASQWAVDAVLGLPFPGDTTEFVDWAAHVRVLAKLAGDSTDDLVEEVARSVLDPSLPEADVIISTLEHLIRPEKVISLIDAALPKWDSSVTTSDRTRVVRQLSNALRTQVGRTALARWARRLIGELTVPASAGALSGWIDAVAAFGPALGEAIQTIVLPELGKHARWIGEARKDGQAPWMDLQRAWRGVADSDDALDRLTAPPRPASKGSAEGSRDKKKGKKRK